jgi:PAS domain S-box-containing protein
MDLQWHFFPDPIRVLLVAGDAGDTLLVQALLAEAKAASSSAPSFQVTRAERLSSALACLEQGTADVILLDPFLPDSRGLEALVELRTRTSTVPVVLLVSAAESGCVREASQLGVHFCLTKERLESQSLALTLRYALDRQHFRAELASSKARLRSMIERNADGMVVLTPEGVILHVNPAAERLFGRISAELVGQPFGFPVVQGQRTELEVVHCDGRIITAEMEVAQTEWEGQRAYLASLRDITAQKQDQDALRKSEERYRLLAEHATDMISRHTPAGTYLYASPASRTLLGYYPAELVGRNLFDFCHADDLAAIRAARWQVFAQPTVNVVCYRMRRKDGTYVWLETTGKTVRDPETGKVQEFIAVSRDVSERKQTEHALERQAEELRRSNAELKRFAYIASHDLQEPLRMVTSYLQLLASRYRERLDTDAEEFIAFAVDGARRMRELINDLLAYSRVGIRGKAFEPTDCETVLARALTNLQLAIEESGAVITHDPLPTVLADASQLAQLLQNLLSNAIKFRGEAAPHIHITAQPARAFASSWQETSDQEFRLLTSLADIAVVGDDLAIEPHDTMVPWLLSVRDNGIGIDPAFAERVFVIFQRLHRRADFSGTGIGLAICKKIVERHGGRIWFESDPGRGTTFYFTLPAAES